MSRLATLSVRFALAIAVAGGGLFVAPPTRAHAADAWVYVVVNDRVCGTPGTRARGILANVQPTGWTSRKWDFGDNIIYPKVRLNRQNTFRGQIACQRKYGPSWITVGYRTVVQNFKPTRHKQTIWLG